MNLKHYSYLNSNDYHNYEFYSEGPKGRIKKLVVFTKISDQSPLVYNLAFGDSHPVTGELDDSVISNNEDRDTVLTTVANTIITFVIIMATIAFTQKEARHHEQDYTR